MQCLRCHHENLPEARFCEACAAPLGRTCSNCGVPVRNTAKFCPTCAHPVASSANIGVGEIFLVEDGETVGVRVLVYLGVPVKTSPTEVLLLHPEVNNMKIIKTIETLSFIQPS